MKIIDKPQVYLISQPQVDYFEVGRYLEEVGGAEWLNNLDEDASDAEVLVEFGGRLCYRSWKPGLNANVTRVRTNSEGYLHNILASKHGSVLEHANFSFVLQDVSRVFTHEMVRHRAGMAVSQESMRYVRLTEIPFWFPLWATADEELMERCMDLLEQMEAHQRYMTHHFGLEDEGVPFSEKKHKTSFMRRFAPDGVATSMLATINVRALRHIIALRTNLGAEEEIRLVMDEIAEKTLEAVPNLMQDYSPNEHREWIPDFLKV